MVHWSWVVVFTVNNQKMRDETAFENSRRSAGGVCLLAAWDNNSTSTRYLLQATGDQGTKGIQEAIEGGQWRPAVLAPGLSGPAPGG
ncbi:hypothetical protein NEUTE2DRAFT_60317 [Neurospora tetrasperma FGSC 2509]|nr:hypothetical protein NEUTE2DRAFT_60317 [Neurospora tetrasperma FGSC 2509]